MQQPPVVVVPGITATALDDFYPLDPEPVWSALRHKEFERIALHPDDLRFEAKEPARVLPRNPYGLVYGDLVEALRHDLTKRADRPTPVFGFGYDWRQDCARSAGQLGAFIDEVLARSALLPHYAEEPPAEVDLVGHSMGGLVIAKFLADSAADRAAARAAGRRAARFRVRRVVTLGTPFRGSMDSILKLATGMGTLTGPEPRDREREASRTIPALYQLLPSYRGAFEPAEGMPRDIFRATAWQPSIVATLREFIRLQKAKADPEALLQSLLASAKSFIAAVNALDPAAALPEGGDGWLPIVGIGEETHVRSGIESWRGQPWFELRGPENGKDADGRPAESSGDGTVPFLGACPDFLERERLVCVMKRDLGFWELKDRIYTEVAGLHGFLPRMNLVQRLAIRFLRKDFGGEVAGRRAPGVAGPPRWPSWLHEMK